MEQRKVGRLDLIKALRVTRSAMGRNSSCAAAKHDIELLMQAGIVGAAGNGTGDYLPGPIFKEEIR